jgi:hypothetical protein
MKRIRSSGYNFAKGPAPDAPKPRWWRGFGKATGEDRSAVHRGLAVRVMRKIWQAFLM